MIRKRLTKRVLEHEGYQPRLVIVAEGIGDVYRLARALEQDTHPAIRPVGQRILSSMDQQDPGSVAYMRNLLGPVAVAGRYRGRRKRVRQLKLELGMTAEDLQALEQAVR